MATLSEFLIEKIEKRNVNYVFGVNGQYINDFFKQLKGTKLTPVFNSDESHSGFAANAYARLMGFAPVCVNYQAGAYKLVNSIACALVERTPLLVISGVPVNRDKKQFEVFKNLTYSAYSLDDPSNAGLQIDRAFEELLYHKQPVYLEVPNHMFNENIDYDVYRVGTYQTPKSNQSNLEEAVREIVNIINNARNPVFVFGVEVARYELGHALLRIAEEFNIPFCTEAASKSVVSEDHPLFAGLHEHNQEFVKLSDCVIMLGVVDSESAHISCKIDETRVGKHYYKNIQFHDLCKGLTRVNFKKFEHIDFAKPNNVFDPKEVKVSQERLIQKISSILTKDMALIADSNTVNIATSVFIKHQNQFIAPAFYVSSGFAIPGSLGVYLAKQLRPVIITTLDSCKNSLSELNGCKFAPIIFVLKDKSESSLKEGVFVHNEIELDAAVAKAVVSKEAFIIVLDK